jgi:hypothetical protein
MGGPFFTGLHVIDATAGTAKEDDVGIVEVNVVIIAVKAFAGPEYRVSIGVGIRSE